MPYTLRFSDASKTETVTVPDMPPGINTIDTTLSFVGKNYPNYGEKIAQNFLSLLENFASPLPPENPIEGQLWYDTSDPNNKILRIMDGTADSTRWPSANGIYQQGTDPKDTATAGLKVGDIWVDTQSNLLKIFHSGGWTTVGPSVSSGLNKTGIEPTIIESSTGTNYNVVISYVNGSAVSIVADAFFVPKIVINGFTSLAPGINLASTMNSTFVGTADIAAGLKVNNTRYAANRFLIKDESNLQQIITGKLFFQTPTNQLNSEGRDGVVIDNSIPSNNTYVQFYKYANDAVILNNTPGGKIVFKTKTNLSSSLVTGLTIENNSVAINTATNSSYALDINGALRVSNSVVLTSTLTNSLLVAGTVNLQKDLIVQQSVYIQNKATITNVITVGQGLASGTAISPGTHNTLDIGSQSNYFRSVYASTIGSTGTGTVVYGRVIGSATRLESSTEFKLQGQVTATSFTFAGTGTAATFNASLTPTAILAQPTVTNASSSTLTLLVIDTSTSATYAGLQKVSKRDLLFDVIPSGVIVPYGGISTLVPDGWLLCDGTLYATGDYPTLSGVLGPSYQAGLNFYVPNMQASTTATVASSVSFINYIIKT